MRTDDILNALKKFGKKSVLYGLATTAAVEGGLIVYHNVGDYLGESAAQPTDATFEQCLHDWDAENIREIIQTLVTLAIFFPATLLSFLYQKFSERTLIDANSTNEDLVLVRNAGPRQESNLMKWLYFIASGIAGGIFLNGVFAPLTLLKAMDTDRFQAIYPNATTEQCYETWRLENKMDFVSSIFFMIGGLFLAVAVYALINRARALSSITRSLQARQRQAAFGTELLAEEERSGNSPGL